MAASVNRKALPPKTMRPYGGGMSSGGSGKRCSSGRTRRTPTGLSRATSKAAAQSSASALPKRRPRHAAQAPARAPNNSNVTGSAASQSAFERKKNIQAAFWKNTEIAKFGETEQDTIEKARAR